MYNIPHRLTLTHIHFLLFSLAFYIVFSCVWMQCGHAQKVSTPSTPSTPINIKMHYSLQSYGLAKSSSSWRKVYTLTGTMLTYEYRLNSSMGAHDQKESKTKKLNHIQLTELVTLLKKIQSSFNERQNDKDTHRMLKVTLQVKPDPKIRWHIQGTEQVVLKNQAYLVQVFPLEEALNKLLDSK